LTIVGRRRPRRNAKSGSIATDEEVYPRNLHGIPLVVAAIAASPAPRLLELSGDIGSHDPHIIKAGGDLEGSSGKTAS
jgi:hypothetical protein